MLMRRLFSVSGMAQHRSTASGAVALRLNAGAAAFFLGENRQVLYRDPEQAKPMAMIISVTENSVHFGM